ncbi:MAG: cobalt-precorrin-6A reductase [Streptosporangiaceae bacterium]
MRSVLVLGGTGEARRLADLLTVRPDLRVVSSLAGRVREPRLPAGEVRVGGFGGPEGLAHWLRAERIDAVVDATHPFARTMTESAVRAAADAAIPLLVLRRPGWAAGPGDNWHWADSLAEAAGLLPSLGSRVFLTTGRKELAPFADLDLWFLSRSVDPPEAPLPRRLEVVLGRGPFTLDGELALLRQHRIDVLVTKDSGGSMTSAKLGAARDLGLPVLLLRRPPLPPGVATAPTPEAAAAWLRPGNGGG